MVIIKNNNCSKNTLLYITNGFPLNTREGFVADEFPILQKLEANIQVFPRSAIHNTQQFNVHTSLLPNKKVRMEAALTPSGLCLFFLELKNCNLNAAIFLPITAIKAIGIALQAKNAIKNFIISNELYKKPLIAYSFWFSEATYGLSLLKTDFPHLRVITRAHGSELYHTCWRDQYLPFRFLRRNVLDVVCPCSMQGEKYLLQEGFAEESVRCSYLGVPTKQVICPASGDDELHLVSCSFVTAVKRLPLMISALQALALACPSLHIVWHHLGDGDGFEALQQQTKQLLSPLPNIKYTLHGKLTVDETRKFMEGSGTIPLDALLNVSESEGLPVSMMEAQMTGIPVIGTDVGGVSEIVTPKTGILLRKDFTYTDFTQACLDILSWKETSRRRQIAERAQNIFSMEKNYTKFCQDIILEQFEISSAILRKNKHI